MNQQQIKRYNKISEDPLYLIDFKINTETDKLEFHISGSTKNIYTVKLSTEHTDCDCPDNRSWAKKFKVVCKHTCFVLFKVIKIFNETNYNVLTYNKQNTNYFNTHKLSTEEYNYIKHFLESKKVSSDVINQSLVDKFLKLSTCNNDPKELFKHSKRTLEPEDDCPICYDSLGNDLALLLSCPDCQNYVHTKCVEKWLQYNKTCVYCRSETWNNIDKDTKSSKYINLG
jgi:hypothetical protein